MLLAIDIGNSHIVLGIFQGQKLLCEFRLATQLHKTSHEYGILINNLMHHWKISPSKIKKTILSSVVPALTPVFEEMGATYFSEKPLLVTAQLKTDIRILYPNPSQVGADRIVNAAAAFHLFGKKGRSLIIVDFGTATTFDLVSDTGDYWGGAIMPGLIVSSEALFSHTAKLPIVALTVPKNIIGEDTPASIQSGLIFGHVGAVNEIVQRISKEALLRWPKQQGESPPRPPMVIATGGLSGLIAPLCKEITTIHPTLTLEGLMIIYQKNSFVRSEGDK